MNLRSASREPDAASCGPRASQMARPLTSALPIPRARARDRVGATRRSSRSPAPSERSATVALAPERSEVDSPRYPRNHRSRAEPGRRAQSRDSPVARPAAPSVVGPSQPIGSEPWFPAEGGAGASWIRAKPDCPLGRAPQLSAGPCPSDRETGGSRLAEERPTGITLRGTPGVAAVWRRSRWLPVLAPKQ
jgi:hypothetical protein